MFRHVVSVSLFASYPAIAMTPMNTCAHPDHKTEPKNPQVLVKFVKTVHC